MGGLLLCKPHLYKSNGIWYADEQSFNDRKRGVAIADSVFSSSVSPRGAFALLKQKAYQRNKKLNK